jgi:ornithine cyclodeaminase/alanine dehydrogenase-like protein (mu-crystallin family)
MRMLSADLIDSLGTVPELVACLQDAFREDFVVPQRQVTWIPGGAGSRLFVSMPAFDLSGGGAAKLVTVCPENPDKGLPTNQAVLILFSQAGTPLAVLDGTAVTYLRTAAASALASQYLSRKDSRHLVIVGTGGLAPRMAVAHCAMRPITRVSVWGRRPERAAATATTIKSLVDTSINVVVSDSLPSAVSTADIVSCATSSPAPVLFGQWLREGTFVDLVGSFSPDTRESDDEVILRSRIFVDTLAAAMTEAGDILDPLARGLITRTRVEGDLSALVRGQIKGRIRDDEITLFKSVGTAIEDFAVAKLLVSADAIPETAHQCSSVI